MGIFDVYKGLCCEYIQRANRFVYSVALDWVLSFECATAGGRLQETGRTRRTYPVGVAEL